MNNIILKKEVRQKAFIMDRKRSFSIFFNAFLVSLMVVLTLIKPGPLFADDAQMKESLVKIINQLQAIKPLINQAQQAQPNNPRIKIHFDSWKGEDGKMHNGLRQDIDEIQQALINSVNRDTIEPRLYEPIKNDFIG